MNVLTAATGADGDSGGSGGSGSHGGGGNSSGGSSHGSGSNGLILIQEHGLAVLDLDLVGAAVQSNLVFHFT